MSDKLSQFIAGLDRLDPSNLGAPANQAALRQFQGLDNGSQRDVLNQLAGKYNTTFDELTSYSAADQNRIAENIKAGKPTFEGIDRRTSSQPAPQAPTPQTPAAQPERPATFEGRWQAAAEASRSQARAPNTSDDALFRERHGDEAARTRHGYIAPEREAQLSRIEAIRSEAKRSGREFGAVADEFVASGR